MSTNLYMIGIILKDMKKSMGFYRKFGTQIPESNEENNFFFIKMVELTFFLSSKEYNKSLDPNNLEVAQDGHKILFEFNLKIREAVEKKYNGLITPFNVCFAIIKDPDGNQILLSGEVQNEKE